MAKIHNSRAKVYETRGVVLEEPTEHIESEGERLIKQMVQKQLDRNTSLDRELNREKNFKVVTEIVPLTEHVYGERTLKQFEKTAEKAARVEELKSVGLTNDEIQMLFDYERNTLDEKYKKTEKSILSARLESVFDKIEEARKNKALEEQSSSDINRHERELGSCVKPESQYTKLYNFALSCQKRKEGPEHPNHPINNLKKIEDDLFGHLVKRPKKTPPKINKTLLFPEAPAVVYSYEKGVSLWDMTTNQTSGASPLKKCFQSLKHVYTCKPENLYTIKQGEIVSASKPQIKKGITHNSVENNAAFVVSSIEKANVCLIPLEEINKNRLSVADIRAIPKFCEYKEGLPSQVLYVKNLAGNVTKDDLVSLFGHFEAANKSRVIYRLMAGRMKGQAFVTFSSAAVAEEALKLVNGFVFKGKPVIMQYGKGKPEIDIVR